MTIDAYKKIRQAIECNFSYIDICESKTKKYNQSETKQLMMELSYFDKESKLLKDYDEQYLQYMIETRGYSKGLMVINSRMILNGEYGIKRTIVTDNLENKPMVIITNQYTLKSLQQFLIKTETDNLIFGDFSNKERNIEVSETEIVISDKYLGKFTKINKKNSDNLVYAEKYKPGYILSNYKLDKDNIFNICSMGELEILYQSGEVPIFAQVCNDVSCTPLLQNFGYNPNSYEDARKFVGKINEEVDLIIYNINREIKKYKENYKNTTIKNSFINKKKSIQTKDIMINLIKHNNSDRLIASEYLDLIKFIYKKLKESQLLDKYEIAFDVEVESLKRVAEYNSDIFVDEIESSDEIRIKSPIKLEDYFERYLVDETIDKIIKNYCEIKNIDDIKPEHFISKLTIQSTPTINFKGAITSNEMSDIVEEIPKVKTLKR